MSKETYKVTVTGIRETQLNYKIIAKDKYRAEIEAEKNFNKDMGDQVFDRIKIDAVEEYKPREKK